MSASATPARRTLRTLLVEDSERDADLVRRRLDDAGYDVKSQRVQTAEAMREALTSTWDVVISDFGMPAFDAFGALEILHRSGQDLPFVVVSGTIGEEVAVECMRAGAHDFFLKGKLTRLPAAIEREMSEAELRRSERAMGRSLEALHDIAFAAEGTPDAGRLARFAAGRARELLGADTAAIYRWDEAARVLRLLAQDDDGTGVDVRVLAPGEGASGAAFMRGEPIVVQDYRDPPEGVRPPVAGLTGSAMAVPLSVGDRVLGTFFVRSHIPLRYGERDLRALQLLAAQVAPPLASAELVEELRHRALHDPLTGLPNRSSLREALGRELGRESSAPCAVVLADLDSFKAVNEALGREAGDDVLRQMATRLSAGVSERSLGAHLGADEFAVLLPGRDVEGARGVATRILRGLDEPVTVQGGQTIAVAASLGIAAAPDHGADAETILRRAEIAMHSAKRSGSTFAVYSPAMEEHTAETLELVGELRRGIDRDELLLHYQRQVALPSMRTIGYEALVRWQHPTRGLLSPTSFIPLAERSGLSRALFEWSLRTALRDAATARMPEDTTIALNISVWNLLDVELPALVEGALREASHAPRRLILEITERGVMADPERAIKVLETLREVGMKISIDDFGTGHSSMAYLQRLPVDEVKIDQAFVHGLPDDRRNVAICRATIDLARGLGMAALAEGVEDERTLSTLMTLGCDRAQGFHVGRPASVADVAAHT